MTSLISILRSLPLLAAVALLGIAPLLAAPEATVPADGPALVVDPEGHGDFRTIGEAIAKAPPGARIAIRPGTYREALAMTQPLHLVGLGDKVEDVRIEAEGAPCLRVTADSGSVTHLAMKTVGPGNSHCLEITRGKVVVEEVDLTSRRGSVVAVHGAAADPTIRRSRLHDGWESGLLVYDGARGRYEDNEITGNALSGVAVTAGGDPTVRNNRIRDNPKVGVDIFQGGRGHFERNTIAGNGASGVSVKEGGDPLLIGNTIESNHEAGIWIYNAGLGRYEENQILDNRLEGIDVQSGAPVILRNRLRGNSGGDLVVREGAQPTLDGNTEGK